MEKDPKDPRLSWRALGLMTLIAFGARLIFAQGTGIHFDEAWHHVTSRLRDWPLIEAEWRYHTHPPLLFGVLSLLSEFGLGFSAFRFSSIVVSSAGIFVFGLLLRRLHVAWGPSILALLYLVGSREFLLISIEVRQYPWLLLFEWILLLVGISALRLDPPPRLPTVAAFALCSLGAIASHFGGGVVLATLCVGFMVLTMGSKAYRSRATTFVKSRHFAVALALMLLVGASVWFYMSWFGQSVRHGDAMPWVRRFLFLPGDNLWAFVSDNVTREFRVLSPIRTRNVVVVTVLTLLFFGLGISLWRQRYDSVVLSTRVMRILPWILLVSMLVIVLALSLVGRYPFGGHPRHQAFLFPLTALALACFLDDLTWRLKSKGVARIPKILFGLLIVLMAGDFVFRTLPSNRRRGDHPEKVTQLEAFSPTADACYLSTHMFVTLCATDPESPPRFVASLGEERYLMDGAATRGLSVRDFRYYDQIPVRKEVFLKGLGTLMDERGWGSVEVPLFARGVKKMTKSVRKRARRVGFADVRSVEWSEGLFSLILTREESSIR